MAAVVAYVIVPTSRALRSTPRRKLAAEELPGFDVSLRSAVSIARRLQDPLAELVKIDPKSIGVGQYQHDMDPKKLDASLAGVVESCVIVGRRRLEHGVAAHCWRTSPASTPRPRKASVDYREGKRRFETRAELKKVKGVGEKAFRQCAGFLRVPESDNPLDNTAVHPESYDAAKRLLERTGYTEADVRNGTLDALAEKVEKTGKERLAAELGVGLPTLADIIAELQKPGRDPRDELPQPVLRTDAMDIASLRVGMVFDGVVRNVADFGAFVDIGVHQDGLVHISKLAKGFVRRAADVVAVGDVIPVRVIDLDVPRKRISLERVTEQKG